MLLRVHYTTKKLSVAEARIKTQEASGVGDRQYRARHEARLLRLVAQALLDLDREDDLHQWGRALEVGAVFIVFCSNPASLPTISAYRAHLDN